MKKKVKKIWLMGKIRELNMNDSCLFEDELNQELKVIAGKKDLSGFKATVDPDNNIVKFWWPIILKDFEDDRENLPEPLTWLVLGMGRIPMGLMVPHFPGFQFYYYIPEIIEDYKRLARQNHASRIKSMTLSHSNLRGMEMELQF